MNNHSYHVVSTSGIFVGWRYSPLAAVAWLAKISDPEIRKLEVGKNAKTP